MTLLLAFLLSVAAHAQGQARKSRRYQGPRTWYVEADEEPPRKGAPAKAASTDEERPRRLSVGAGTYTLWRSGKTQMLPLSPALLLEVRGARSLSPLVSFEWNHALTIQDFEAIGDIYSWYFGSSESRATRLLLLWPGLILAPLSGSNLSSGPGLLVFSAEGPPRLYFDVGMQLAAFVRPSESDLPLDLGLQSFAGLGAEWSEAVGVGLRAAYGLPLFHGFSDAWRPRALTLGLTMNLAY